MLPTPVSRLIVALVLALATSVLILVLMPRPQPSTFEMEIAKALLQLGVVSVVGVVLSILVFEYQRARNNADKQHEVERRALEYRKDLLKATLAKAMACYSQAKKARRLFRAKGLHRYEDMRIDIVIPAEYDKCLESLNDAQLELENLARDVNNSQLAFSNPVKIVKSLRATENYLSDLIGEYERKRGIDMLREEKIDLEEFPILNNFLVTASQSRFNPELIVPYHEVQEAIRQDLLHPRLPPK